LNAKNHKYRLRGSSRRRSRRGVEIAELAFALPVFVVLVFGVLECCELLFLKQSLSVAAYEAGRVAARPDTDAEDVTERFNQIVAGRRVNNATLVVSADPASLQSGETIQIDVTAPFAGNSTTSLVLTAVPDISERVYFLRE